MPKTQYMTIDEMAKIFATPITTKHGGEQAFIDFCRYDEDKNTKHMNDMLQSELDRNHIMDRNYLIRELKNDLKGHEALFERLQHKIIENDITTYDKLLKLLQQEKMNVDEKKQLEYIIDLAEYMSSSPKPPKDYKNIVLQFQQALSDKTPEAKEFLKNLTLFITAFHSERDDSIARAMRILANKIQDQKVLYNLLRDFGFDQTVETNEILWRTKYDLIINKTPSCATADNIFSYVKDMEWLTGHFDQKLYERGLQRFYEEINEEAAKDKPDFDRLNDVRKEYLSDYEDIFDDDSEQLLDEAELKHIEYSKPVFDLRIRVAMLEAENKKLKSELKKIKTTKLKTGIANVVKKPGATKSTMSKQK